MRCIVEKSNLENISTLEFNIEQVRKDFPVLSREVYGKPLVYLDNGATTQKPLRVINRIQKIHTENNSSIHRGVHYLSEMNTEAYENARKIVQKYLNARSEKEIIFTSGATASINSVAFSFGEKYILEGDEIVISEMEHHANIVPWQMLCERKKAVLKIIPFDDRGELLWEEFETLLNEKTKIVAITHVSNSLGTVNPVKQIIETAHKRGIPVLVDGAQAIQHTKVDVTELDCDFYVFSGHKVYGPTGIGVLYGKEKFLEEMPPYQGGGDMVDKVTFKKTTYNELPFKFEAGTMNYVGAIGFSEALLYLEELGLDNIEAYEKRLLDYAMNKLSQLGEITFYGTAQNKISILSFLLEGIHQYDAGMVLDKMGIAVRTGTHCTQPVMEHFGIDGTIRASMVFYNTFEEVDRLYDALIKVKHMFG